MKKKMVSVLLTASMLAGMTLCAVPVMAEDAETPENEVTGDASADDSFVDGDGTMISRRSLMDHSKRLIQMITKESFS